ncbi:thiol-disulfide oxidoreductase DCC family protein [Rhizobium sp. YTU87027]|uniref:thiol-disulfide oxidoreductase DCC family protein n=1 Tax=Rhizobium sp. YTU87027 TaxID=3417741 RepID=UPI003D690EB0
MTTFEVADGSSQSGLFETFQKTKPTIAVGIAGMMMLALTAATDSWDRNLAPLGIFFPLLIVLLLVTGFSSLDVVLARALTRFAVFLSNRGAFSSNPEEEAPKFAFLRVIFGALLLERAVWILAYLGPSDWDHPWILVFVFTNLICAVLVTAGFLTQYAFVFLIVAQWQIGDRVLATSTLGNYIAATFSVLLLFANAGAHFSLDGVVIRRKNTFANLISAFYYKNGIPSVAGLQISKFITLSAYWCVCLYSLVMHLGEPAWMNGTAGPHLLTNNFMSRYSSEFAWLLSQGPIPVFASRIALWAMLPWYLVIVPFVVLGGWFRQYVIIWGALFFALSLFVLQLGWLAHFEFLFFAGLFWQRSFISGPKRLQVAYDDRCNLCDRTVRFVKAIDLFRRVELRPLSTNTAWLVSYGIDPGDAQKDLYAIDAARTNNPVKGYDFYLFLSSHVLLLLPIYPILLVGKYLGGPAIYRFVAERRTKLFGICQIPTEKPDYRVLPLGDSVPMAIGRRDPIGPTFLHMIFLMFSYILAIPAPQAWFGEERMPENIQAVVNAQATAARIYGVDQINVFNHTDLRMSEGWFTLSKKFVDGIEQLLPIFTEGGKRLSAHRSDRIYFGNTVRFRRGIIAKDGCQFAAYKATMNYLVEGERKEGGVFVYRQYFEPLPSIDLLLRGQYVAGQRRLICEVIF